MKQKLARFYLSKMSCSMKFAFSTNAYLRFPFDEACSRIAALGYEGLELMADVPGAKLWGWDTGGHGEPIVLLHPNTGSAASWGYQQPVFARAGHRVVAGIAARQ